MRPQRGDGTRQADRPAHGAGERQTGEARAQPVERQRIRRHVGEHAQGVAAHVEPHRAAHRARRGGLSGRGVAVPQRAAELGIAVGTGERAGRVEHAVQRHRRRDPAHRAQVHRGGLHAEAAERQAAPSRRQVHVPSSPHPGLRPAGDQRVAEDPVHLEGEVAERPVRPRVAREPAVERQAVEEGVRQPQVQVARLHVGLPQRHEPGVRRAHRGEPSRQPAAAVGEIERIDVNLEQTPAVRADVHVAREDGARRKAAAHKLEIGERGRVRPGGEVVEHGVPRPPQPAFEAVPRARHADAPQVGVEGIAGDADAALQLGDA